MGYKFKILGSVLKMSASEKRQGMGKMDFAVL